ncbi:SnoaL-like domain-containing protein [Mucilaginibacter terrae]|uniref:SnoaL-like domain-containing protein n=1 Tax=Mucilaginibacter terrae TaxID=1955052 RepID=UPI0036381938
MKTKTEEVANRYYELAQRGQIDVIKKELYATDIVSIEPENNSSLELIVKGTEAYEKKEAQFFTMYNDMYGGFCSKPLISTFHFTCAMGFSFTLNGEEKTKEEIAVFEVKNGKIVKEQFFYNDFEF